MFTGAGIHVFVGIPSGSLPNNGLVVTGSYRYRFRFYCRSDSTSQNVGELVGLDGSTVVSTNRFLNISTNDYPFYHLSVLNSYDTQDPLPSSEQGVYTCHIPLQSGEMREINIGIYSPGFNCESPCNGYTKA